MSKEFIIFDLKSLLTCRAKKFKILLVLLFVVSK